MTSDLDRRLAALGVKRPVRRRRRATYGTDGRRCFDCDYPVKVKVGDEWACARCRRAWWSP